MTEQDDVFELIKQADEDASSPYSVSNKLVVEAYKKEGLRAKERNGFAMLEQKSKLVGLKLLMPAVLANGDVIKKGAKAYIKEEWLHNFGSKPMEAEGVSGQFIVVELSNVDFVQP